MVDGRTHTDRLLLHLCSLTKKYPPCIPIIHVINIPHLQQATIGVVIIFMNI